MIRPATICDLPSLLEIEARAFSGDRITRRAFRYLLTRANALSLVDEQRGQLCGYVTLLFKRGSGVARLYSIAVHPDCRGQRIGLRLVRAAERECRRRNCRALRLEAHPENRHARHFYAKGGFRQIGMYRRFYEDGSDAIRMEKCLHRHREQIA